ncbi:ABC transporter substrate-binding protein [Streptomyces sp. NPDC049555]|uniref:ABC transporter family substrate-binding protein n=1 Tax=Streptomyces sp. NPDC049555 TaxID=3154930 RepID=UPI00343F261B
MWSSRTRPRSTRARTPRSRTFRSLTLPAAALLALPVLAGCAGGGEDEAEGPAAPPDIAAVPRAKVADQGTLTWAVDALPATYNAFHADADETTQRVAGAVLPALFTLDERGRPRRNPDYLTDASVVSSKPHQVVRYKLNPKAVWSDGTAVSAADFAAQWKALRGKDSAYFAARNAGYERIDRVEQGANAHEVKVTFARNDADWRALFTPLYPKALTNDASAFNDASRKELPLAAGPFQVAERDQQQGTLALARNPRWWGERAKLDRMVLRAVPREQRVEALAGGKVDLAEITPAAAERIMKANAAKGTQEPPGDAGKAGSAAAPGTGPATGPSVRTPLASPAMASPPAVSPSVRTPMVSPSLMSPSVAVPSTAKRPGTPRSDGANKPVAADATLLRGLMVRRSLEPAYTQLALNGASGPLADERVRRAIVRAVDRKALAEYVLGPLGLPVEPLGSHLLVAGQPGYADHSDAVGSVDLKAAMDLLADAGWKEGHGAAPARKAAHLPVVGGLDPSDDPEDEEIAESPEESPLASPYASPYGDEPDGKGRGDTGGRAAAAPARFKDGRKLVLRFVLPNGSGAEPLRAVGERIARQLDAIGVRTELVKVEDAVFFKENISKGKFDLALFGWPTGAFPATDARPVFAKPQPAPDGSLTVEQNYTRVGTDQIDQLFDKASAELDEETSHDLLAQADARIWAAAGSLPLYQRPELVATRRTVVNAGAFGMASPRYQDIGFLRN